MLIVKLFCDRDAQRSLQREKRQTQLTLESHVLVVEERNGQIEILTKEKDKLKEKLELTQGETYSLEQRIAISEIKLQEIEKEKELLYINKVDEIHHNQYRLVTFHAYIKFTEFLFNHQEEKISCSLDLNYRSFR